MTRTFTDISGPDMAVWCEMLRDDNAIHLDRDAAERAGFGPRLVNPGPANLAYLMTLVSEDLAEVDASFTGNVFDGDDLTADLAKDGTAKLTRGEDTLVTAHFTLKDTE